jgi:fructose-specific phosphotransferase system IIB component
MNIVAVTSCPTGIAHTYMAAEQLEKTGTSLGHDIKVETQGSIGIENELTLADIARADVVIFAADIDVEKKERFRNLRIIEVSVTEAIKSPHTIFQKVIEQH